jgi:hypothetical protein
MPLRLLKVGLILAVPVLCAASDDSRPACTSQIQGRMWPDAANHDPKVISRLARCGELFICVRGSWHYHWQAPSVRVDQLAHGAKSKASTAPACEAQSVVDASPADPPGRNPPPSALER